jgi:hypothetical protein
MGTILMLGSRRGGGFSETDRLPAGYWPPPVTWGLVATGQEAAMPSMPMTPLNTGSPSVTVSTRVNEPSLPTA